MKDMHGCMKRLAPEKKRALAMSKMKKSHAAWESGSESSELSKERRNEIN